MRSHVGFISKKGSSKDWLAIDDTYIQLVDNLKYRTGCIFYFDAVIRECRSNNDGSDYSFCKLIPS